MKKLPRKDEWAYTEHALKDSQDSAATTLPARSNGARIINILSKSGGKSKSGQQKASFSPYVSISNYAELGAKQSADGNKAVVMKRLCLDSVIEAWIKLSSPPPVMVEAAAAWPQFSEERENRLDRRVCLCLLPIRQYSNTVQCGPKVPAYDCHHWAGAPVIDSRGDFKYVLDLSRRTSSSICDNARSCAKFLVRMHRLSRATYETIK